jgi:4-amino-4-deoxy-L-arabinose transferase-like glycosyltransferase
MVVRRFGHVAGIAAAGCYALCPMTIAFGDMPDFVAAPLVFMSLLTAECFARFMETADRRWLITSAVAFVGGALVDWPIFFLPPALALAWMSCTPWRAWWRVLPLGAGCAAVLLLLIAWTQFADQSNSLWKQIATRIAGTHDQTGERIPISAWLWRVGVDYQLIRHATIAVLALVYLVIRKRHQPDIPLILLGWGLLHLLIGYQGNYQHSFWSIVVTPGLAAASGVVIARVLPTSRAPGIARIGAIVVPILIGLLHWPTSRQELFDDYRYAQSVTYTQRQLGEFIRENTAPRDGVLTSDNVWSPALWFYADRQLRPVVRSIETFEKCLADPHYLLPFHYYQPSGPSPRWFILPDFDRPNISSLAGYLDARYVHRRADGFVIYDLATPHPSTP